MLQREKNGLFGKISKIDKYTLNCFTIKSHLIKWDIDIINVK